MSEHLMTCIQLVLQTTKFWIFDAKLLHMQQSLISLPYLHTRPSLGYEVCYILVNDSFVVNGHGLSS